MRVTRAPGSRGSVNAILGAARELGMVVPGHGDPNGSGPVAPCRDGGLAPLGDPRELLRLLRFYYW